MKNMSILAIAVLGLSISLVGCDSLFTKDTDHPGEEDTQKGEEVDVSAAKYIIGKGYDVFTYYADPNYTLSQILDFDALEGDGMIERTDLDTTTYETVSGEKTESYQNDYCTKLKLSGNYKCFSGTLNSSFSKASSGNSAYQYATIQTSVQKVKYAIKNFTEVETVKKYLAGTFKAALNAADTEEEALQLFKVYGTHALTAIIMGARYDYNLEAQKTSSTSSTTIKTYAQAKYSTVFSSVQASCGFDGSSSNSEGFSNTSVKAVTVGGVSTTSATDAGLSGWLNSITDENAVFSDFASNGLMPIWELADDAACAATIEAAFSVWEESSYTSYIDVNKPRLAVIGIDVKSSNCGNSYEANDLTYCKIASDCNKNAGGDDVFVYVAYGLDDGSNGAKPITDIAFVLDDDKDDAKEDCASDFILCGTDLNADAEGDFIYLVYRRGNIATNKPIRSVYIRNATQATSVFPYDHEANMDDYSFSECKRMIDRAINSTTVDLNKNAGGDDIFLYVGIDK